MAPTPSLSAKCSRIHLTALRTARRRRGLSSGNDSSFLRSQSAARKKLPQLSRRFAGGPALGENVAGGLDRLLARLLAEKSQQKDVLRFEDGVALQFADPVAVRVLARIQGGGGPVDGSLERRGGSRLSLAVARRAHS